MLLPLFFLVSCQLPCDHVNPLPCVHTCYPSASTGWRGRGVWESSKRNLLSSFFQDCKHLVNNSNEKYSRQCFSLCLIPSISPKSLINCRFASRSKSVRVTAPSARRSISPPVCPSSSQSATANVLHFEGLSLARTRALITLIYLTASIKGLYKKNRWEEEDKRKRRRRWQVSKVISGGREGDEGGEEEEEEEATESKLWKDKRKSGNRCYDKRRAPGYFVANPF